MERNTNRIVVSFTDFTSERLRKNRINHFIPSASFNPSCNTAEKLTPAFIASSLNQLGIVQFFRTATELVNRRYASVSIFTNVTISPGYRSRTTSKSEASGNGCPQSSISTARIEVKSCPMSIASARCSPWVMRSSKSGAITKRYFSPVSRTTIDKLFSFYFPPIPLILSPAV